jgi:hypothetical protein
MPVSLAGSRTANRVSGAAVVGSASAGGPELPRAVSAGGGWSWRAESRSSNASSTKRESEAMSLFFVEIAIRAHLAASANDPRLATSRTSSSRMAAEARGVSVANPFGTRRRRCLFWTGLFTRGHASGTVWMWPTIQVGRIKVILVCDRADQREQSVPAGVGERGPHPMRGRRLRHATDRPIRRNPFAGFMGKNRGQVDGPARGIDRSRLHDCDLLLA